MLNDLLNDGNKAAETKFGAYQARATLARTPSAHSVLGSASACSQFKPFASKLCPIKETNPNMKFTRLLAIAIVTIITACAQADDQRLNPTLENFQAHLKADMAYPAMVSKFGSPSKDIGSGIHIYVYPLSDSTEVWIGYSDKLLYARQVDAQGHELLRII
jgi:hypothetical protein